MDGNTNTLLVALIVITGASLLLQAGVLVAIFIALKKTVTKVEAITEDLKTTVIPAVHQTRQLIERITPQVISVTSDASKLAKSLADDSANVKKTLSEVLERVDRLTKRLDEMLSTSLNKVERVGGVLESAVSAPVRQVNGLFQAAKAIIDSYRSSDSTPRKPVRTHADGDMFV